MLHYVWHSVHLAVCLCVHQSMCLSIDPSSIGLSLCLSISLCDCIVYIHPPVSLSVCPSICLCGRVSSYLFLSNVYRSICLSVRLSVHRSVCVVPCPSVCLSMCQISQGTAGLRERQGQEIEEVCFTT